MRGRTELVVAIGGATFATSVAFASSDGTTIVFAPLIGAAVGLSLSRPTVAWVVVVGLLATFGAAGRLPLAALFLLPLLTFGIARQGAPWRSVVGLVALVVVVVARYPDTWVPGLLLLIPTWIAGRMVRERDLLAARLAQRARELEAERDAYAQLSVRYERARIAAELHDIVAHAISVMVVQAAAGQRIAAIDPELTAETFHAIADAAQQAKDDMGRLVELLGDPDAIGPAPDLALVEELVSRAAGSGLNVRLRLEGQREGLPASAVQAAYRVVQEGLTNALRYAAGATVEVLVRGRTDDVEVEVRNGPAPEEPELAGAGTGNGLRGLRERLDECGGTLEAGPTHDGGWRTVARMPRRTPATVGKSRLFVGARRSRLEPTSSRE